MRSLAAYIVRGRMQAALVAVASALLLLILLPLGYPFSFISGAAVALATLRLGMRQGLLLVLWAVLAVGGLGLLWLQNPMPGAVLAVVLWLPVWAMAVSLRRTAQPRRSLLLATIYGLMAVLAFHYGTEDPVQWWNSLLQEALQETLAGLAESERGQLLHNLELIAGLMTGFSAAVLTATLIGSLMLGRWWQAVLYNPGGFGEEFRRISMGKPLTLGLVLLAALMSLTEARLLFQDMVVVLIVPFTVQGLAVVHTLVKQRKAHNGWLAVLYLLLFIATGQIALLLALVGAIDNWFDFRRFFGPKGEAGEE
ncbi:MAG: DUF2232 domain-containing protein [Pseudomonadota bacterium]